MEMRPVRSLGLFFVVAATLRIPFAGLPLQSDEGGFLMVAEQWHGRGSALYTDQWVDRPPLLLLVFKLAAWLGGTPVALRLLALAFGFAFIAAAWWAGRTINGTRGALAGALVATLVSSAYSLDGFALTGECVAGAFVMISCALALQAKYGAMPPRRSVVFAVLAGVVATMAFLCKQNFIDGGIFAAVLLSTKPVKNWRLLLAGAAGAAVPLVITASWALSGQGPGLSRLVVAIFRFRQRSFTVIEDASMTAPLERLRWLGILFVATGLIFVAWQLFVAVRRVDGRFSVRIAVVVAFLYAAFSILVGASWWSHYLLQLSPAFAMSAALSTKRPVRRLRTHWPVSVVAVCTVTAALFGAGSLASGAVPGAPGQQIADYLRSASKPGDDIVIAYGSPNIIEASGLSTPYRYSWSLPVRTRDPHLRHLVSLLRGPLASTWLLEIGDFNWWGLDTPQFARVRAQRYRVVSTVCGHDLYLLDGQHRELPSTPAC